MGITPFPHHTCRAGGLFIPKFPLGMTLKALMKNAAMEAALLILSRFELLTFRLGGGRSIQLSYRIKCIKA